MNHSILFDNSYTDWDESLPMGNGVFGCMSYFKPNKLTFAYNHYEVYYTSLRCYSKSYQKKLENGEISYENIKPTYEEYLNLCEEAKKDYTKEGYINYQKVLWKDRQPKASKFNGESHAPTGELSYKLSNYFNEDSDFKLKLEIEEAKTKFHIEKDNHKVDIESIILNNCDISLTSINQNVVGDLNDILVTYPQRRNHKDFKYEFFNVDDSAFYYKVSFYPDREDKAEFEPFSFAVIIKLIGALGESIINDNNMTLKLKEAQNKFYVLTCVSTELQSKSFVESGIEKLKLVELDLKKYLDCHKEYWNNFFSKSQIQLEDKILEKLWYYNIYILNCCSGRKGKRLEQASGLNGLWDIKQPTIWGSMWYWDVNIEATYWPVYTSNHLELAEVFNDGFLSHVKMAKKRALEYYKMDGIAIDYPHQFYNCIGPWCSQFLWWHYEYILDTDFLRYKAYPVIKEQIKFITEFAKYDDKKDEYYIFPDVSPEQGPITRNSVITISTIKYLFEIALKANKLLDNIKEDNELYTSFLNKLPDYPIAEVFPYGKILKDSEYAPPHMALRHPSLLMPIFPISEINMYSDSNKRELALNTLKFAINNTELGVFGFGWLSCAASRLGMGDIALRALYEKGLDLIIRSNGMGAEYTDRWLNHCCVNKPPYYYPFMMECVGEVVASVNEMLLQSYDNIITVFPAIPNGENDTQAYRLKTDIKIYKKWSNCSFKNLLAKGGVEVSASMIDNEIKWIELKSKFDKEISVRIPKAFKNVNLYNSDLNLLKSDKKSEIFTFKASKGKTYIICSNVCNYKPVINDDYVEVQNSYVSHFSRRVFIGKDKDTDYIKKLDSFLFDYYVANDFYRNIKVYWFNFGLSENTNLKYGNTVETKVEPQFIRLNSNDIYTVYQGFGFETNDNLKDVIRNEPDILRQAFVESSTLNKFKVELPKGRYDFLIVCGDYEEASYLKFYDNHNNLIIDKLIKRDSYLAEIIPVIHKDDGIVEFTFDTLENYKWKLNLILIKRIF